MRIPPSGAPYWWRIAPSTRHCSLHAPHFRQRASSMTWRSLGLPLIQLAGQCFTQRVHPLHLSVMWYFSKLLQTPAGQFLSTICAIYSSRKYFIVERIGFGADCPSPQREVSLMILPSVSSLSKSSNVPLPSVIFVRISSRRFVPTRQAVQRPQDSSTVNSRKNLAIFTIQSCSSKTISPPDPIMEPMEVKDS